jgi:UrcA family protein
MSSNVTTLSRVSVAFATAMLLAFAVVSNAHADEQVRSETVKFGDLDVGSPSGAETLYKRIHAAAVRVCFDGDLVRLTAVHACTKEAEARAIEKGNLQQLTAFYQMKTGGQKQPLIATR